MYNLLINLFFFFILYNIFMISVNHVIFPCWRSDQTWFSSNYDSNTINISSPTAGFISTLNWIILVSFRVSLSEYIRKTTKMFSSSVSCTAQSAFWLLRCQSYSLINGHRRRQGPEFVGDIKCIKHLESDSSSVVRQSSL